MDTFEKNQIDDYLLGRLDGDALSAFEQRLKRDAEFADAVAEQKQAMDLIGSAGDMEMKLEVREVQKKFQEESKPKPLFRRLRPLMAVAAGLLILVVTYWSLQSTSHTQLFDNYYTAYNTGFGDRDAMDSVSIQLAEASQFYRQKDYRKALNIIQSLKTDQNAKLQVMTGICYLELGEYDQANKNFIQLFDEQDPVFQYHGLWYSALTYLKAENPEKAKAQLEKLVKANDPNGVFKLAEAAALLKKI